MSKLVKILIFVMAIVIIALALWSIYYGSSDIRTSDSTEANLSTKYIHAETWPPEMKVVNIPYSCEGAGSETKNPPFKQISEKTVNGRTYCITTESEGAAGSTYTKYNYSYPKNGSTVELSFTLRLVQCGNYPEEQQRECEKERSSFDLDSFVDKYIQNNPSSIIPRK